MDEWRVLKGPTRPGLGTVEMSPHWRWIPKDDSLFEALLEGDVGLSHTDKSAVMLRLCLGSIRDYGWEVATAGRQPNCLIQPTTALPECGKVEETDSITSYDSDSVSDDGNNSQGDSNLSEDGESSGDSDVDNSVGSKQRSRLGGQRVRWSTLDEQRLRSYVKENKGWSWIADKLCRTETAVEQHWRGMNQRTGRKVGPKLSHLWMHKVSEMSTLVLGEHVEAYTIQLYLSRLFWAICLRFASPVLGQFG
jgi:hypothetical protein